MEAVSGETENIAIGARQTLFYKLKKDWKIILILTILILLGIVVRLVNYSDVGYWNDDPTTVPTALAWFYPHPYLSLSRLFRAWRTGTRASVYWRRLHAVW